MTVSTISTTSTTSFKQLKVKTFEHVMLTSRSSEIRELNKRMTTRLFWSYEKVVLFVKS